MAGRCITLALLKSRLLSRSQVHPGGRQSMELSLRAFSSPSTMTNGKEPRLSFQKGAIDGGENITTVTQGDVITLCKDGRLREALHILDQQGGRADSSTFVCLLQGCMNTRALAEGKQVHAHIRRSEFKPNVFVVNSLVNMYAKCGSMVDARQVFEEMPQRDRFTWTMLMAGYAKHGHAKEALKIYKQMHWERVIPDKVTYTTVLNVCASLGALEEGKQVHADIIRSGIASDYILENALIDMFAKCGSIGDARQVFDSMAQRDVVSWNTMITGYAQSGHGEEALKVYEYMQQEGVIPNRVTLICILNACASVGALEKGKQIHADIKKTGIVSDVNLETTLVDMYAKCGSIKDACEVFDRMPKRDVVSWNVMIAGFAQCGHGEEALKLYEQMQRVGVLPDRVTYTTILNACASLGNLEMGKQVHSDVRKIEIAPDVILENTLVDMYAKCGSIEDARQVFDKIAERDVVSWSAMITGYAQHGCGKEAFKLYEEMQQEGVMPNRVSFICILNACASLGALEKVRQVHAHIIEAQIASYINLENTLVDTYAKCGSVEDARQVFDKMVKRDVFSWSAMIAGYAQHGCGTQALKLFVEMRQEGITPDAITFTSVLTACSHGGLVDEGLHYFESMSRDHSLTPTVEHFGCMVDLLGRVGLLEEAEDLINKMPIRPDAVMWATLLGACKIHGDVQVAECAAKAILELDPQDPVANAMLSKIYAEAGKWDDKPSVKKVMEEEVTQRCQGTLY